MTTLYRQAWGISMCTLILSVQWVTAQNLRISEVFFHSPDVSDIGVEYFEISGPAGMTLTDHTYFIVIRGDADPGGNQGTMFLRFDLGGRTIGPNGYLVVAHNGFFLDVDPDATSLIGNGVTWGNLAIPDFGFRNTSHSFLLITSTDRVFGGDYDADNDGNLDGDATNWTILDGVGYLDGDASDVGYGLINFAYENLGTSVNTKVPVFGLLPGYFARIGSSTGSSASDWIASHINGAAAADFTLTPGSTLPGSFGGTPLNHVGSANPSVGRPSGPFDLQNGLALTQIITNNDDNSVFGRQIDVDAGTAVVSCEFCGPRAAFVYEYNGSQWVRVARLTPSSTASGGSFARSVAIDGDVIVVSNGRNRVYVYEKPPGGWADATETAILSSNDALSGSYNLGETIDIDDNTIIAYEAIFERIVVFEKTGANWVPANETATITGTNTYSYSEFGRGAEIRGDVILAALDGDISAINAALPGFVFTRPPAGWVDTDIDQAAAMLRDTTSMFMGVPYDTYLTDNYAYLMFENNNMNSHRVHIYEKPTGGWGSQNASAQDVQEPIAFLSPSSSATNRFGFSIAGDGDDVLYVGDDQFNSNQGRVEAYLRPCSGRWQSAGPSFVFQAPDNTDDDRFGVSVAVNDDGQLLVGAEQLTAGGKNDVGGFYALDRLPANTFDVGPSDITLLSVNNDAGALVQTYLLDTATVRSAQPSLSTNGSPKIIEASDQQIYGVSRTGDGFVWRSFADGRNFEVIHQFTGTGAGGNGHDPTDLIELSDGRLCGITVGDAAGMGVSAGSLFILDKDGSNFSNIWTFDASTFLISPTEVFQASNGKIYVSFALGQLYRIDPDGTNLTDLLTTRALDSQALVEVKGKLYGRSRFAGANGRGIIYELDLATDAWSTLYDLTTADGHGIGGGLIAKGDLLYGTNNEGGANGRGTAFLYDLNSSQYTVLHDFPSVPSPTLRQDLTMASDGNIYGLTDRLSSSIFRIHTGFCRLDSVFTYAGDGSVASNFLEIINTPPVLLGAIADTTVLEDAANVALDLSTVFAASDEPANYLEPTAISSDTTLFDSLSIDLGILTVDLAENASGQATITLRATDSRGAFVETSFMVTVEPVIDGQPSVATGFTMTYGDIMEASEALGIGPNAVDSAQMTFLKVSDYANVRLFQMDGTTEVVENSFLPTSIDSIRVLPLQTGAVSFKLQASTLSDDLGLGGTQVTVNGMVNQRSLTVTANDTTAAYGAVLPTFEGTVVGLANADYYSDNITVSYTTTATGDSIATFPILPIVNDPDTRLPNYNLVTNDGTFTVGAASLV
ncbi:MAG: choice-of-anchor tandem repeat GloVer-containing protein, partial [Bacteroidota bacterium]